LRAEGKTESEIVKLALANLSTFAIVGLQERLDVFADVVAKKYSVSLSVKKVNVAAPRPKTKEFDTATIDAIRAWSSMDIEVYEQVSKQLSEPVVYQKSA
jgi:hypothetical protein